MATPKPAEKIGLDSLKRKAAELAEASRRQRHHALEVARRKLEIEGGAESASPGGIAAGRADLRK